MSNSVQQQANSSLSLKHLQVELARIDALLHREIWRWQLANQDAADPFRGFAVSHQEAEALLQRAFATSWGQLVSLPPDKAQIYEKACTHAQQQTQAFVAAANESGQPLRLHHLAAAFGLDSFELDALLICLAPTIDLRYEQIYGYLQDHVARKRPSINLALNLLGDAGPGRLSLMSYFNEEAPLFKFHILKQITESGQTDTPLLSQTLAVDKTVVAWLWGNYHPPAELGPNAVLWQPQQQAAFDVLLTDEMRRDLADTLAARPVVVFYGADRGAQQAAARYLASQARQPLLQVDLATVNSDRSPLEIIRLVLRDALLNRAIPCLFGWDIYLEEHKTPPHLLAELCIFPGLVIVAGQENWQSGGGLNRKRTLFWQEFTIPDYKQRRMLWNHFLDETQAQPDQPALDPTQLADQFYLATDQIRDAIITAADISRQRHSPMTPDDLFAAARIHSTTRLASLAQKITPRYDWTDLILPDDQITMLHEVVNTMRERSMVLEGWGIGQKLVAGKGLAILFAGPPGTGKTMAAEVMAFNLGLDLYKIDLSTIVSKYIGETEKNLERIFTEAESSNAILFFDEADALFGKRSEVQDSHDRYANIEVSYLLQRMEAYNGVTILATNLRGNLDEAFSRRLHFTVSFPFPDEEHRRRIWHTLFPQTLPRHPNLDLDLMAHRFKLAGGNIRNVIVSAAYLAASDGKVVTMEHLMHSTARELQKMGRLVRSKDLRLE